MDGSSGEAMLAEPNTSLVGVVRRRSWKDILTLRPPTRSAHLALVMIRRGQLAGLLPANARHTLSDYLVLPYEYREVDMRERLLVVERRCESADAGHYFTVNARLIYQVVRPERVAVGHIDVLSEFESLVAQRMSTTSSTLGIEQVSTFREYFTEALLAGNEVPRRFDGLGLMLCRADIDISLGAQERMRADAVRELVRERPLKLRLAIESSDPDQTFDVLVGVFYRLKTRDVETIVLTDIEATIRTAISHTLHRIGMRYSPREYRAAAAMMTEDLWNDGVLKADLLASGIELLRPAAQIQLDSRYLGAPIAPALTDATARPLSAGPSHPLTDAGVVNGEKAESLAAAVAAIVDPQPAQPSDPSELPAWMRESIAAPSQPAPFAESAPFARSGDATDDDADDDGPPVWLGLRQMYQPPPSAPVLGSLASDEHDASFPWLDAPPWLDERGASVSTDSIASSAAADGSAQELGGSAQPMAASTDGEPAPSATSSGATADPAPAATFQDDVVTLEFTPAEAQSDAAQPEPAEGNAAEPTNAAQPSDDHAEMPDWMLLRNGSGGAADATPSPGETIKPARRIRIGGKR